MAQARQLTDGEIEAGHKAIQAAIAELKKLSSAAGGNEKARLNRIAKRLDTAGGAFREIYPHRTFPD